MTDPLNIPAIRARADAATPGPWEWGSLPWMPSADAQALLSASTDASGDRVTVLDDGSAHGEYSPAIDVAGPDAAFIAAARTDIPALCDEVERLRDDLAGLRAYLDAFAVRNASDEAAALSADDQDRFAAYVRALVTPYAAELDELQDRIYALESAH